jgi:nitronate monooxygenase
VSLLAGLIAHPIIQAPMAGGPGSVELAAAVSRAGGLGFLAAGYRSVEEMRAEITEVRRRTEAAFGVNVFVPQPDRADPAELARYLAALAPEAEALGVALGEASWDDDHWAAKIESLVADPVAVVSFSFGCPDPDVVAALRQAGSMVMVTVTTPEAAVASAAAGAQVLCLQGVDAGGHQGVFADTDPSARGFGTLALLGAVRGRVAMPLVAAGGLMDGTDVAAVLVAGADAAQLGTAFLRCPEAGTNAVHRAALDDPGFTDTVITSAFSGRPAGALANRFTERHRGAPEAYPQINKATAPIRRAAIERGEAGATNLWAGVNFSRGQSLGAAELVSLLVSDCEAALSRGRGSAR